MSLIEETNFAMKVHQLLSALQTNGIGLVKLAPPHSAETTDVVAGLGEAVEQFARNEALSEGGRRLLHNYLSDHLFEVGEHGFGLIPIEKEGFTRA